jgi:hypothetical protein
VLKNIEYWYLDEHSTYIKTYDATQTPYTLIHYVPNRLIIQEIECQTTLHGFVIACLIKHRKEICPTYPLYISMYMLTYSTWVRMEGAGIEAYHFNLKRFQMHDPLGIFAKHILETRIYFSY